LGEEEAAAKEKPIKRSKALKKDELDENGIPKEAWSLKEAQELMALLKDKPQFRPLQNGGWTKVPGGLINSIEQGTRKTVKNQYYPKDCRSNFSSDVELIIASLTCQGFRPEQPNKIEPFLDAAEPIDAKSNLTQDVVNSERNEENGEAHNETNLMTMQQELVININEKKKVSRKTQRTEEEEEEMSEKKRMKKNPIHEEDIELHLHMQDVPRRELRVTSSSNNETEEKLAERVEKGENEMEDCLSVLRFLMTHSDRLFHELVNIQPDSSLYDFYKNKGREPMDFTTIKKQMERKEITSRQQFSKLVRHILSYWKRCNKESPSNQEELEEFRQKFDILYETIRENWPRNEKK
jgi:hypothetical protein